MSGFKLKTRPLFATNRNYHTASLPRKDVCPDHFMLNAGDRVPFYCKSFSIVLTLVLNKPKLIFSVLLSEDRQVGPGGVSKLVPLFF
jgi:hypothetical protein